MSGRLAERLGRRCGAVALGLVAERVVPDPPTPAHPVAWFGTAMGHVESTLWSDARGPGVAYASAGLTLGAVAGSALPLSAAVVLAVGGRQLRQVGQWIADAASAGDLDAARDRLPWLVGRDPSGLDTAGISAAVIESVAENTVDAVFAPALWAVVAGGPGALAYRAVNTMDAMVGHRTVRHERFGWAAARLDDLANLGPARLLAATLAVRSHRPVATLRAAAVDGRAHPSPNAGLVEATMGHLLGRSLGGTLHYGERTEDRPVLGTGPRPGPDDVAPAIDAASWAQWVLTAALALVWLTTRPSLRSAPPMELS